MRIQNRRAIRIASLYIITSSILAGIVLGISLANITRCTAGDGCPSLERPMGVRQDAWNTTYVNTTGVEITTDSGGYVYYLGQTWRTITYEESSLTGTADGIILIKYMQDGTLLWNVTENRGTYQEWAEGVEIATDGIILVGSAWKSSVLYILLIKYSFDGRVLWRQNIPVNGLDRAFELAIDEKNNIFIAYVRGYGSGNAYLLKCNPDGYVTWNRTWYRDANNWDNIELATMGNQFVYVLSGNNHLTKYDTHGQLLLSQSIQDTTTSSYQYLALDTRGDLLLAGDSYSLEGGKVMLSKISPTGAIIWSNILYSGLWPDSITGFGVDATDNIFLVETKRSGVEEYLNLITKYSPNGGLVWRFSWSTNPSAVFAFNAMCVSEQANVILQYQLNSAGAQKFEIISQGNQEDFLWIWFLVSIMIIGINASLVGFFIWKRRQPESVLAPEFTTPEKIAKLKNLFVISRRINIIDAASIIQMLPRDFIMKLNEWKEGLGRFSVRRKFLVIADEIKDQFITDLDAKFTEWSHATEKDKKKA